MSHEFQCSNGSDEVRLRPGILLSASFNCTALESTISCPLYQDVPGIKSDAIWLCWFTDWEWTKKKHEQCFTLPRKSNLGVCRLSVIAALVQSSLPYAVSAQYELWTSTDTRPSNFARRRTEKIWRSQARTAGSDPAGVPPCLTDRPQVRTLWWVERIAGNIPASLLDRTTVATCDSWWYLLDLEKLLVQGCHHPAFGTYHPLLFSLNVVVSSLLKAEHRSRALLGTEIAKWHDRLFQTWRFTDPKVNYEFFPKARNAKETLSAFYQPVAQKCTHRLWNILYE